MSNDQPITAIVPCSFCGEDCGHRSDEIDRLRAWKAEATVVIGAWEDVWYALGQPGELGESKAIAALRVALNGS